MTEPTPYRAQRDARGQLLTEAARLRAWSTSDQQQAFRSLSRRLAQPTSEWRGALRFAAVATALGLAVILPLGLRHRHELALPAAEPGALDEIVGTRDLDLGAVGELSLTDARLELPPSPSAEGYRVKLRSGHLCAKVNHRDLAREGPFLVEAPHLQVTVIGTRFCVQAASDRSTIAVSEGKVRVSGDDGAASAFVSAGETLASDAPALRIARGAAPSPLVPAPVPSVALPTPGQAAQAAPIARPAHAGCGAIESLDAQEDCYAGLVAGDDLAAEDAVYSLAMLRRDRRGDGPAALSGFRAYLARFPQGSLAPEASQNILSELLREQRPGEALSAADDYLRRFARPDRRTQEVALTRAKILRADLGRYGDALTAYAALLETSLPAELREEALFSAGDCEERLGRIADARARYDRYLREFPSGPHAAEARARAARKTN